MNGITYVTLTIGLTCLTGSIWTGIWYLASKLLRRNGTVKQIYRLIKIAAAGYCVPLMFLSIFIYYQYAKYVRGNFFQMTPAIQKLLLVVFIVWAAGVLVCSLTYVPKFVRFRGICRLCMPVPLTVKEKVQEMCTERNIRIRVRVRQGYRIAVPFIYGVLHPCIYLPVQTYSEEELEMILTHELVHLKQRDIFWKPVFLVLTCIYWFNPLVWFLSKRFQKWAEANCDCICCEYQFLAKDYFLGIMQIMSNSLEQIGIFAPTLKKNKSELQWRIETMVESRNRTHRKWITTAVTAGMLVMMTVTTYGAELGVDGAYSLLYDKTVVRTEEPVQNDQTALPVSAAVMAEEYADDTTDMTELPVLDESSVMARKASAGKPINIFLPAGYQYRANPISKQSGGTLYIDINVEPGDQSVEVGIIQPDNSVRYVKSYGSIVHTFNLTQTGDYTVFIANKTGVELEINGYYK